MPDQPSQAALNEAVRRIDEEAGGGVNLGHIGHAAKLIARLIEKHEPETLVDPVEEARKVKAREIAAQIAEERFAHPYAADIRSGICDEHSNVEAALAALSFADWRP